MIQQLFLLTLSFNLLFLAHPLQAGSAQPPFQNDLSVLEDSETESHDDSDIRYDENSLIQRHYSNFEKQEVKNAYGSSEICDIDFSKSTFKDSEAGGIDFMHCKLSLSNFIRTTFDSSCFYRSKAQRCAFDGANFSDLDAQETDFSYSTFRKLKGCIEGKFIQCTLNACRFIRADLYKSSFLRCQLEKADFSYADLTEACFNASRLCDASFIRLESARDACFEDAHLEHANFTSAKLKSSNFSHAFLQGANFSSANLHHADLRNADLRDITIDESTIFAGAKFNDGTLMNAHLRDTIIARGGRFVR